MGTVRCNSKERQPLKGDSHREKEIDSVVAGKPLEHSFTQLVASPVGLAVCIGRSNLHKGEDRVRL